MTGYYKDKKYNIDINNIFEITSEDNLVLVYFKNGDYKGYNKITSE